MRARTRHTRPARGEPVEQAPTNGCSTSSGPSTSSGRTDLRARTRARPSTRHTRPARGEPVPSFRQAQDERVLWASFDKLGQRTARSWCPPSTGHERPSTSSGRTDLRARTRHTRPVRGEPVHPSTSSGRTGVVGVLRHRPARGEPSTSSGPSTGSGRTDAVAADSPLTRRRPSDWRGASRVCLSAARPPQAARSRRCLLRSLRRQCGVEPREDQVALARLGHVTLGASACRLGRQCSRRSCLLPGRITSQPLPGVGS